jgi:hypothetical protein
MPHLLRYGLCFVSAAALAMLVISIRKHDADSTAPSGSINTWDIPELAVHLNRMGIEVRMRAVPRHGSLDKSAYLTATAMEWKDLNALSKDPRRIEEWLGTIYCERVGESDATYLIEQWGDHCLAVGPFLFYGDPELLKRVKVALASIPTPTTP